MTSPVCLLAQEGEPGCGTQQQKPQVAATRPPSRHICYAASTRKDCQQPTRVPASLSKGLLHLRPSTPPRLPLQHHPVRVRIFPSGKEPSPEPCVLPAPAPQKQHSSWTPSGVDNANLLVCSFPHASPRRLLLTMQVFLIPAIAAPHKIWMLNPMNWKQIHFNKLVLKPTYEPLLALVLLLRICMQSWAVCQCENTNINFYHHHHHCWLKLSVHMVSLNGSAATTATAPPVWK